MHIINTLFPVFAIIILGMFLRWRRFFDDQFTLRLNKLAYYVALPTLLFYKVAVASYKPGSAGKVFLIMTAALAVMLAVSVITAIVLKLGHKKAGAFLQGAFRSNLAYVGLPIFFYSLDGVPAAATDEIMAVAALVLGLIVIVNNFTSVIILMVCQHRFRLSSFRAVLLGIVTNPLIIATLLGVLYSLFFDSFIPAVNRTLSSVSDIALPIALLGLGARIASQSLTQLKEDFRAVFAASAIRVFLAPAVGYFIARFFALGEYELRMVLIFLACPTAIASYVLALEMGADERIAAKIVVLSAALSMVSLSIIVGFF